MSVEECQPEVLFSFLKLYEYFYFTKLQHKAVRFPVIA